MMCNAYYLSDKKGISKCEYHLGQELSGKFYHKEIKCTNKATNGNSCILCVKREEKLKRICI